MRPAVASEPAPLPAARPAAAAQALPLAAAALLAADPVGLAGAVLRGGVGPGRERWLARFESLLAAPLLRAPGHPTAARLLGGLDVAATLAAGRPVAERGLLQRAGGGALVLPMAERLDAGAAAVIAGALDMRSARFERDGLSKRAELRLAVIALDEAEPDERGLPAPLGERLAFHLDLAPTWDPAETTATVDPSAVAAARARLRGRHPPVLPEDGLAVLCGTAARFGIDSLRAPYLAVRAARAAAALRGADGVEDEDLALAARLVFGPRAVTAPPPDQPPEDGDTSGAPPADPGEAPGDAAPPPAPDPGAETGDPPDDRPAEIPRIERIVEAVQVVLPPDLELRPGKVRGGRPARGGRSAEAVRPGRRGAPIGVRPGDPRDGSRLDLLATLRAAVPWQRLRPPPADGARLAFRRDDLRVRIHADRPETLTVFIVDASGSQALRRLAEAKGAVERLLAESYVERARVALVMFRGRAADVALAPTRSLVRARRVLAGVPGGGTTPLAAGIEAGARLATAALREDTPTRLLLLTDGRANIARDGATGRGPAEADALAAARAVRRIGVATAVVDTSPRGQPFTVRLAEELGGTRAWLPAAHSSDLCRVLDHVTRDPGTPG